MNFRAIVLCASVLALAACGKHAPKAAPTPSPTPTPVPTATPPPTPTPTPTPTPFALDKSSQVIVLCYHRFEEKPKPDGLGLKPSDFEAQMQALKDQGITVISMDDFLDWRAGTKNIPAKSAVITLDDGWLSGYTTAWPILKKYGYPFTMFIYTKFVNSGGKSITWTQLEEMRDAGVDIESHTVSHPDLRKKAGKTPEAYDAWLLHELKDSKDELEERLGIQVTTLAFPYGGNNEHIREIGTKAGYKAMFTVYGQRISWTADNAQLGRYAVEFAKPEIFQTAANWSGIVEAGSASQTAKVDAPPEGVNVSPKDGAVVNDPSPIISADLSTYGNVNPTTITMRISGFGLVPAKFDPATKTLSYKPTSPLIAGKSYSVIVIGPTATGKIDLHWKFDFAPAAAPAAH